MFHQLVVRYYVGLLNVPGRDYLGEIIFAVLIVLLLSSALDHNIHKVATKEDK